MKTILRSIRKSWKKHVAVFVASVFSLTAFVPNGMAAILNAPPVAMANVYDAYKASNVLPMSLGKITTINDKQSPTVIVNIQDLHSHADTQRNIYKIIDLIAQNYNLSGVYTEGGFGNIDVSWINTIQDQEFKKTVIEQLLSDGDLTASEYYAMTVKDPYPVKGLENKRIHQANIKRLADLEANKERYERVLNKIDKEIAILNKLYTNYRSVRFNKTLEQYNSNKMTDGRLYKLLEKYVEKISASPEKYNSITRIDLNDYPNIQFYLSMSHASDRTDYKRLTSEIQTFVNTLKSVLPYSQYKQLVDETNNFSDTEKMTHFIAEYFKAYPENYPKYRELSKLVKINELVKALNPVELITEQRELTEKIKFALSYDNTEAEIAFITDFNKYFRDYLMASLMQDDWTYVKANIEQFKEIFGKYAAYNALKEVESDLAEITEYYDVNTDRNNVFLSNLSIPSPLEGEGKGEGLPSAVKNDVSLILKNADSIKIVITGGYHSEGLKKLFADKNISSIVITPNVTSDIKKAQEKYMEIVKEQAKFPAEALAAILTSCTPTANQIAKMFQAAVNAGLTEEQIKNLALKAKNIKVEIKDGEIKIDGVLKRVNLEPQKNGAEIKDYSDALKVLENIIKTFRSTNKRVKALSIVGELFANAPLREDGAIAFAEENGLSEASLFDIPASSWTHYLESIQRMLLNEEILRIGGKDTFKINSVLKDIEFSEKLAKNENDAYNADVLANSEDPMDEKVEIYDMNNNENSSPLTVKDSGIATNLAGVFALEAAVNYLRAASGKRRAQSISDILNAIIKGKITVREKQLLMRFANATWKTAQPFRAKPGKGFGSRILASDVFIAWDALPVAEQNKDMVQIKAAAEMFFEKLKDIAPEKQTEAINSLYQDKEFLEKAAIYANDAYNRSEGTDYAMYNEAAADDSAGLTNKDSGIATNLAGFYALETAIGYLRVTSRKGQNLEKILRDIAIGNITDQEKQLLMRFANATWKIAQPFRVKKEDKNGKYDWFGRIDGNKNFRVWDSLPEREQDKDMVQIKEAAINLLYGLFPDFSIGSMEAGALLNEKIVAARAKGRTYSWSDKIFTMRGEITAEQLAKGDFNGKTFKSIIDFTAFSGSEGDIKNYLEEMCKSFGKENILIVCGAVNSGNSVNVINVAEAMGLKTMGIVSLAELQKNTGNIRQTDYYYIEKESDSNLADKMEWTAPVILSQSEKETLEKVKDALQDIEFAETAAAFIGNDYNKKNGYPENPVVKVGDVNDKELDGKDGRNLFSIADEKIAMNLAGFYAVESAIGLIAERTGKTFLDILIQIQNRTLPEEDMLLINRFANATWKASQPFRVDRDEKDKSKVVGRERITKKNFIPAAMLSNDELKKDFDQVYAVTEKLLSIESLRMATTNEEQLAVVKGLLQSEQFAREMAEWLEGAYHRGQGKTPPAFITNEDTYTKSGMTQNQQEIAMNLAGLYAVESGIGYLAETQNKTFNEILQSIIDGSISETDMLVIARFANATWKAGQPFRALNRITRDTFRPAAMLIAEELKKDFDQINAAAEVLNMKLTSETSLTSDSTMEYYKTNPAGKKALAKARSSEAGKQIAKEVMDNDRVSSEYKEAVTKDRIIKEILAPKKEKGIIAEIAQAVAVGTITLKQILNGDFSAASIIGKFLSGHKGYEGSEAEYRKGLAYIIGETLKATNNSTVIKVLAKASIAPHALWNKENTDKAFIKGDVRGIQQAEAITAMSPIVQLAKIGIISKPNQVKAVVPNFNDPDSLLKLGLVQENGMWYCPNREWFPKAISKDDIILIYDIDKKDIGFCSKDEFGSIYVDTEKYTKDVIEYVNPYKLEAGQMIDATKRGSGQVCLLPIGSMIQTNEGLVEIEAGDIISVNERENSLYKMPIKNLLGKYTADPLNPASGQLFEKLTEFEKKATGLSAEELAIEYVGLIEYMYNLNRGQKLYDLLLDSDAGQPQGILTLQEEYALANKIVRELESKYLSRLDVSNFQKALEMSRQMLKEINRDEKLTQIQRDMIKTAIMAKLLPKTNAHQHLKGSASKEVVMALARKKNFTAEQIRNLEAAYSMAEQGFSNLDDFNKAYGTIGYVIRTADDYKEVINGIISDAAKQGQTIVEIRCAVDSLRSNDDTPLSKEEGAEVILNAIREAKEQLRSQRIESPIVSFVFLGYRGKDWDKSISAAEEQVDLAIQLAESGLYNDISFGFDIAGPEDAGHPPKAFSGIYGKIREYNDKVNKGKLKTPKIGMTIHSGETPKFDGDILNGKYVEDSGREGNLSIQEAIDLGVNRIGHAVRAIENPDAIKALRETGTTVEICGVCNILSIPINTEGLGLHPIKNFIDGGVPVTICTDNNAICASDITMEYLMFLITGHDSFMNWNSVKKVARQGIMSAFISDASREEALRTFQKRVSLIEKLMTDMSVVETDELSSRIQSQEELGARIAKITDKSGKISDSQEYDKEAILSFPITQSMVNDLNNGLTIKEAFAKAGIPAFVAERLGLADNTEYSAKDFIVGGVIAAQPYGNRIETYIPTEKALKTKYQNDKRLTDSASITDRVTSSERFAIVLSKDENSDIIRQLIQEGKIQGILPQASVTTRMIKTSELGYPVDTELIIHSPLGDTQTKKAGVDAYIVIEDMGNGKFQYYMVQEDNGLPVNYILADTAVASQVNVPAATTAAELINDNIIVSTFRSMINSLLGFITSMSGKTADAAYVIYTTSEKLESDIEKYGSIAGTIFIVNDKIGDKSTNMKKDGAHIREIEQANKNIRVFSANGLSHGEINKYLQGSRVLNGISSFIVADTENPTSISFEGNDIKVGIGLIEEQIQKGNLENFKAALSEIQRKWRNAQGDKNILNIAHLGLDNKTAKAVIDALAKQKGEQQVKVMLNDEQLKALTEDKVKELSQLGVEVFLDVKNMSNKDFTAKKAGYIYMRISGVLMNGSLIDLNSGAQLNARSLLTKEDLNKKSLDQILSDNFQGYNIIGIDLLKEEIVKARNILGNNNILTVAIGWLGKTFNLKEITEQDAINIAQQLEWTEALRIDGDLTADAARSKMERLLEAQTMRGQLTGDAKTAYEETIIAKIQLLNAIERSRKDGQTLQIEKDPGMQRTLVTLMKKAQQLDKTFNLADYLDIMTLNVSLDKTLGAIIAEALEDLPENATEEMKKAKLDQIKQAIAVIVDSSFIPVVAFKTNAKDEAKKQQARITGTRAMLYAA
ncbi:MAG: hypothetical protein FWH43_00510 [Endomicrobia bacterium]|nr:hypothetical protein [Endomicrobiia bacterium]